MRILLTPLITHPRSDTSYYLSLHIASLLRQANHIVAISSSKENRFHHVSLYPCAQLKPVFSLHPLPKRNYEEWMYANGASSAKFLEKDLSLLEETIIQFKPDLIITMDRIASVVAARKHNIPCYAIVHSDMYKTTSFDPICLTGLNAFLSENRMEQIYRLKDIYLSCEYRFGFGPIEIQPFSTNDNVTRIGIHSIMPVHVVKTNRVCIFLDQVRKDPIRMKKIITSAFEGAPYSIYAYYEGCHAQKINNIHFLSCARADLLPGSIACVHDGNDYYTNQCLARGIRQLIITDHSYIRNSNALAVQRNRFGIAMFEEDLTMENLYEQYRLLLSDDKYYYYTQAMKQITQHTGDLSQLLDYIKETVNPPAITGD